MKKQLCILFACSALFSCGSKKHYTITSVSGSYIPVTPTSHPDKVLADFISPYRTSMDKEMNTVIGHSEEYMTTDRPESLLTNLTSDLMMQYTDSNNEKPIELAFMNVHGIRASIPKGDITRGMVYDAFPFDNMLSIVKLRGEYLYKIFESYARMGGAGVSKNVKLVIQNKELKESSINGKPVDKDKIYTILTLDYLAEGNDGMDAMKQAESVTATGIALRDYMLSSIADMEKNNQKVSPKLDGRIVILE